SSEQIAEVPTPNPMQAIQARTPGVDVVAGGSYRPGVPMNVTVRGVRSIAAGNQPLYVVDGVPLAGGIEDFNPAIIQSIEVLKEASATAVYGSRGSNGVILITTRRGAAGAADNSIHVSYDAQYGGQTGLHPVDMMHCLQAIARRQLLRPGRHHARAGVSPVLRHGELREHLPAAPDRRHGHGHAVDRGHRRGCLRLG